MYASINGQTRLTCLLGSPVSHSISPAMHNEAFRLLGLNYTYLAFDVNEDSFSHAIEGLRAIRAAGWNCTMPLKRLMYQQADELSDTALLTGAVNTVVNRNGILYGDNTDGCGFMQAMADAGFSPIGKKMTILGSGGAAAAIIAQAAIDGVSEIDIFSRSQSASTKLIEQEASLIRCRYPATVSLYDLEDLLQLKQSLSESYCLINASSVGMAPHENASLITDKTLLHPELVVGDVIYNPRKTQLLSLAQEVGCPTFNGLYMLLHQGARAFQLFTGEEMPVEAIRQKYFQG